MKITFEFDKNNPADQQAYTDHLYGPVYKLTISTMFKKLCELNKAYPSDSEEAYVIRDVIQRLEQAQASVWENYANKN